MAEFKYFTRLPPEIRNEIYKLLFVSSTTIRICSPINRRKRRPPRLDFTRLLLVNKQINAEAKTMFYSPNAFAVGNGDWASRRHVNLHALKAFTSRIPKACISIITKINVHMAFYRKLPTTWTGGPRLWTAAPAIFQVNDESMVQLQSLARSVVKHFTGVELIEISTDLLSKTDLRGDFGRAVKAVGLMLTLPNLKKITFRGHLDDPLVEQVIKRNEEKKDIISISPPSPFREW